MKKVRLVPDMHTSFLHRTDVPGLNGSMQANTKQLQQAVTCTE